MIREFQELHEEEVQGGESARTGIENNEEELPLYNSDIFKKRTAAYLDKMIIHLVLGSFVIGAVGMAFFMGYQMFVPFGFGAVLLLVFIFYSLKLVRSKEVDHKRIEEVGFLCEIFFILTSSVDSPLHHHPHDFI